MELNNRIAADKKNTAIDVDQVLATRVTNVAQARDLRAALTSMQTEALKNVCDSISDIKHDKSVAALKRAFEEGKWLKASSDVAAAAAGMVACNSSLDPMQRVIVGGALLATAVVTTSLHVARVSKDLYGSRGLADKFSPRAIWDNSVIWSECVLANGAEQQQRRRSEIPENKWLLDKVADAWRVAKDKTVEVLKNPSTFINFETLKGASKALVSKVFEAGTDLGTKAIMISLGHQLLESHNTGASAGIAAGAMVGLVANRGVHAMTGAMAWSYKAIDAAAAMTGMARYLHLEEKKGLFARGVARVIKALDSVSESTEALIDKLRSRGSASDMPAVFQEMEKREIATQNASGAAMFNRLNELRLVAKQARDRQLEQEERNQIRKLRGADLIDDVAAQAPDLVASHDVQKTEKGALTHFVEAIVDKAADKGVDAAKDAATNALGTKAAEQALGKGLDKIVRYGLGL